MICSKKVALSLLTLSAAAIAAFFLYSKGYLRHGSFKKKPSSQSGKKDIISKLPDDILVSIISHLPVKCGIRTSILSNRWWNLYRYVSTVKLECRDLLGSRYDRHRPPKFTVYFDEDKFHDTNLVIVSAIRFLRLRFSSTIRYFHLSCCFYKVTPDQLKEFFCTLRVEKLALSCGCYLRASVVEISVYNLSQITSLQYLKLSLCTLVPISNTQYSSLQIISLSHVKIKDGTIESIFSNCLVLRSLRIGNCKCPSKLCFKGPNLQLKSLCINNCKGVNRIEFDASSLVLFEFSGREMVDFIFEHVPQLQSISLYTFKENNVPYACSRLAKDLPRLKSLTFVARGDHFQGSVKSMGINMFNNLRRLDLSLYSGSQIDLLLLTSFLRSCPLLQEFHLNTNFVDIIGPEVKKQEEVIIHSELKKMEISGFVGTENEIEFASYILKSATCLEKMVISRCLKKYTGSARRRSRFETPWSEEMRRTIHARLQGKAISEAALVVIQYHTTAHIEDDNWGRTEDDCMIFA
ncbi:PREDICTED: FBD-associated F-box protein At5g60610-like isoform X1 [Erythranthe guttata]|uniref:FBD-associated F-box protein At5g60610-like isoform X1 n=1 Tax=Erythranthe guttata TaxID=4155 RepID=UPI00064D9ED2|nr:PREDICTED: FBD-associated F-box protein At5g60610-like isoform X1 [Erythranthe guttata]|eukprot:XP_012855067.1 PREDICTED: FBD-associated F-box protein At5g60610-like isoform X1 [Erythranthe guttata]